MAVSEDELAKDLGLLSALTIGIGTMVGAGIFVLPGTAVQDAGPFAIVAFVLGGIIALFTALSASELGTAMPRSGGAYFYVNRALGPLFGSIAGWANWIGLAFASAFYMFGFGEYVNQLLGIGALGVGPVSISAAQAIGLVGAGLFIGINYVGAKETGILQIVIVTILVSILTLFTIVGVTNADLNTLRPLPSEAVGEILPVTGVIFVSYLGFVQITSVGEEIKNPGKNLPRAVIGSVVVVTAIYAIFLLVLLAAVPVADVAGNDTAVVEAAELLFGRFDAFGYGLGAFGFGLLVFGGLLATASSANASILSSSRINFAMGRDKIVSTALNEIHPRFGTPYRSIAITGALIVCFLLTGNLERLAKAGSVLHLVVYGLLNLALIVMRESNVEGYDPDFRVPLYPFVPIVGAVSSFALIAYIDPIVIGLSVAFVFFAAGWYLVYARTNVDRAGVLAGMILDRSSEMPDAAVSAASAVQPTNTDGSRVMVALANPETEPALITLGSALARQQGGSVLATHIVTVPDQTPLQQGAAHVDRLDAESAALLERAREDAETFGVDVETKTIISHRSFEEIFDAAAANEVDTVVVGWGGSSLGGGRVESALDELVADLPCDVVVLDGERVDADRILVPTAGGADSDVSAAIARALRDELEGRVSVLYVADETEDEAAAQDFVREWASENGLADARILVDAGNVEAAIERRAAEHTMVVVGASRRGLLGRLRGSSPIGGTIERVDVPVILAEKRTSRPLRERVFGWREP